MLLHVSVGSVVPPLQTSQRVDKRKLMFIRTTIGKDSISVAFEAPVQGTGAEGSNMMTVQAKGTWP